MDTIELCSLPKIKFAHIHSAESYANSFRPRPSLIEVTYISEGSLTYECDGSRFTAGQGDVICNLYRSDAKITSKGYHIHHTVCANAQIKLLQNNINGLYLPIHIKSQLGTEKIQHIIDLFIRDRFTYINFSARGSAKFLELLCEIDFVNRKEQSVSLPSEVLYTQLAKEYIHNNIHLPITQRSVAEHLSISPEYLCSIFKKTEGITLIKYANTVKLGAVRNLMKKEKVRLYVAAEQFGFADANYVSRLFKKYFGYNITE